ncbi:MAG: type II toxin-antitoxin system RelE/ParE family toxin [Firmicutes bacterium]|nr:type II toxin-antitoxin system RelE/ParE family toxin [Bacillota bacterium]
MIFDVVVSDLAENDIKEAALYISNELKNPQASQDLLNLISEKINDLSYFPYSYPICSEDPILKSCKFRILPIKNYLIFYRVNEKEKYVIITRFLYKRRNWVDILKEI